VKIRCWRLSRAAPYGLHLWFDPDTEVPTLRLLTEEEKSGTVDMVDSVSAPTETETPLSMDEVNVLFQRELPF